jgi:hypothetical protein
MNVFVELDAVPTGAKAPKENRTFNAALKRCATQERVQHAFFRGL